MYTHCSNPNPNPYLLPNHYLIYIVCPQILQQMEGQTYISGPFLRDYGTCIV